MPTQPSRKYLAERMQVILNCKPQSKDNQATHCAEEPFPGFWKQPWSEGHRQKRNILCPEFPREKLVTTFQNPTQICKRDLCQMNQEIWIGRPNTECNAGTRAFKAKKKKKKVNTCPYNPLCWVYKSTDTGLKTNLNINKQIDARGVYLPSQSLKIELCQERLFLYFWDVTPELWRFSLHLLVRGNQPQSAKFIKERYT